MRIDSYEQLALNIFNTQLITNQGISFWTGRILGETKLMEIPVHFGLYEVPVFALQTFPSSLNCPEADVCVVELSTHNLTPSYVTVGRYMKDILLQDYYHRLLIKLEIGCGEDTIVYYGTHGAIFDANYNPVMMCSWQLSRSFDVDSIKIVNKAVCPILRISPKCFLEQADPIQKFIVKKMIPACLNQRVEFPNTENILGISCMPKVIIEKSPFGIREISSPTVYTTNERLLQAALEHVEEIV